MLAGRQTGGVTQIRPAASDDAAQWLLRAGVDWWDLVRYGPPGFDVYVRIALVQDPDGAGTAGENPALRRSLATLASQTATPANGYAAVWEGWTSGHPLPQAPRVLIPHRAMLLFTGPIAELRDAPARPTAMTRKPPPLRHPVCVVPGAVRCAGAAGAASGPQIGRHAHPGRIGLHLLRRPPELDHPRTCRATRKVVFALTSSLPSRPDLEHLRRAAKNLLRQAHEGDPVALSRLRSHAPGLGTALSTAQLVIAREHGFASWAQLKSLVTSMVSGGVRYDAIGRGYAEYRRADPRIAATIHEALGDARTVVNVGAGTGSYEPTDRPVIPIEPSTAMALQRPPNLPPAVIGVAESIPLADGTVDAAMAVLTVHHWADTRRGLAELVRVARRRIVLLTIDPEVEAGMWLFQDYLPDVVAQDRIDFPTVEQLTTALGPTRVVNVPVPRDCSDGFLLAFWGRPEAILDPGARAATSGFARMDAAREAAAVERLERDLTTGAWDRAYGHLRTLPALDVGLRL